MKYGSKYLLASVLLHLLCFGLVHGTSYRPIAGQAVEVTLLPRSQSRKQAPIPGVQKTVNSPRVGSEDYDKPGRPLGQRASAENYIARLKAHIDPHWRRFIAEALRHKEATFSPCVSVLSIDADAQGNILAIYPTHTTCSQALTNIAIKSVNYAGLLPPPRDILVKNTLYLEWSFSLVKE